MNETPLPPDIRLTLRPLTGAWVPVAVRLRRLLKFALRVCGLRCLSVEEIPANEKEKS